MVFIWRMHVGLIFEDQNRSHILTNSNIKAMLLIQDIEKTTCIIQYPFLIKISQQIKTWPDEGHV